MSQTNNKMLLYLEDIAVNFNGFQAIQNLNFYLEENELRCLIGPNGAGKTTIMDIITGKTKPDSGTAFFGESINLLQLSEDEICQAGIVRKFQKPTVFEKLTVFDNLLIALEHPKGIWQSLFFKLTAEQKDTINQTLEKINLFSHADKPAGLLSHGQKQWLELGILLVQHCKLLLIDEPVAGMTHQEIEKTAELFLSLKKQHTLVVVEHDMDFVRSLNSRTTVLHQGTVLAEGKMEDIQNNPKVMEVYLGENIA